MVHGVGKDGDDHDGDDRLHRATMHGLSRYRGWPTARTYFRDPPRGVELDEPADSQNVRRQLNIHPVLTIRPGFPLRVIVNRNLLLARFLALN